MTREEEFKQRFAAVLKDMQQDGIKDMPAMILLGSLASDLSNDLKAADWTRAKQVMTPKIYNQLLTRLSEEGNAHLAAGTGKHAYAIQALSFSLIAGTQRKDPVMRTGEELLDVVINRAIAVYRAQPRPN
jgi:hypothetical protein